MTSPNPDDLPTATDGPPTTAGQARWFRTTSASSLGIEIAVCIVLGFASGRWLENHVTHWKPGTSLIFLGLGCAAAVKALMRTVRQTKLELEAADKARAQQEALAKPEPHALPQDEHVPPSHSS